MARVAVDCACWGEDSTPSGDEETGVESVAVTIDHLGLRGGAVEGVWERIFLLCMKLQNYNRRALTKKVNIKHYE